MARRSKISQDTIDFVRDLRRKGRSHDRIVEELAARGTPLSKGTVHKIAPGRAGRPLPPPGKSADAATVEEAAPPVEQGLDVPPADADIETLRRWLEQAESMAQRAYDDGDLSGFATMQRRMQDVWKLIRLAAPPPVQDPNELPDMVAAAKRARERLHAMIDRALTPTPGMPGPAPQDGSAAA